MSSTSTPIPAHLFAAALPALPLSSLHAKAAELRNSISHLQRSNTQLQPLADAGDRECRTAVAENEEVIRRMEERVGMLRGEVEGRGYLWDGGGGAGREERRDGEGMDRVEGANGPVGGSAGAGRERGGRLGDEELARRLRERVGEEEEEGDGVHL